MKLRVVFAGTPAFALPPLAALHAQHELVGVMTQPDRPAGRGRVLTPSPVKEAALGYGVPVMQPERLRGDAAALEQTLATLREWQPDVIVVVAYGLILPESMLNLPRLGCLNIHASLLPRWRGAAPIQRAILAGDAHTGVAIMQMDAGLDTGPVLVEASLAIEPSIIAAELHDQLAMLGAGELLIALGGLTTGTLTAKPQSPDGVTYAAKLSKAEARIDWSCDALQIDRQIRAFNPWPVAEATLHGESVKLLRSTVAPVAMDADAVRATAAPGTVLGLREEALEIVCGAGVLRVSELQRAGRRAVRARDFLNAERRAADAAPLVFQ
jgi:methionyl-tRNA formyltransferase